MLGFCFSVSPLGIHDALTSSLTKNEPYEVLSARTSHASGLDKIVAKAPRGISYSRVIQDIARAIEEDFHRYVPEELVCRRCSLITQKLAAGGALTAADAAEWEKAALDTVRVMAMTKEPEERTRQEAREAYEVIRKEIHGPNSEPSVSLEGEQLIKEKREERYWTICQRLASMRAAADERRVLEMYHLASSLEKLDSAQAIELYSRFASEADLSRLYSYVLGGFERISLLHERAKQLSDALQAITRFEETAAQGNEKTFLIPKHQAITVAKRKSRILHALSRLSGPKT